jgi:hypothetical protein
MYMKDWLERLDDFLRITRKELLMHAGKISQEVAGKKALAEFSKYHERTAGELSSVERHFIEHLETAQKQLEGKNEPRK